MLCYVFIINCKTNNKSLGIAVSTARKINPVALVERADGDGWAGAKNLTDFDGGLNERWAGSRHFY